LVFILPALLRAEASPGKRTGFPDHRLGPLRLGITTEKDAVARLGEGFSYPIPQGRGHCWAEERLLLCTAFRNGKLSSLSISRDGSLPFPAQRSLRGPEGGKQILSPAEMKMKMRPNLFLASLFTETGLRVDQTEREVLAALGSPHTLAGLKAPFHFIYPSTKENDPACPGTCGGVYTLNKEDLVSIYLAVD